MKTLLALLVSCVMASACAADRPSASHGAMSFAAPAARWDGRAPASDWTRTVLAAAKSHGLAAVTPSDIGEYCPGYVAASADQRAAFWVGVVSNLARHESGFNPRAVGGGGKYFGLMQISPATARSHGCAASGSALKDGAANLACATRILATQVRRDGVVAAGARGAARDWGPLKKVANRTELAAWSRKQPYCALG